MTTVESSSRIADVSLLTEVIASSSNVSLQQILKDSSQAYLSNLTTLGLQDLLAEPTTLQTQSHHLTSSLTSLTHTSYPTFLSLHHTTNALIESLTSLSSSLDGLLNSNLPALETSVAGWKEETESVLKERNKARLVLDQHEKIRDLLDIPILIDTCARNGYFAEALSLVAHAKGIAPATSNKTPSPLLTSVHSEIHHSIIQMLLSLLATLHEPNRKLPVLYKAVNFLRKMDVFGPTSPFTSAPHLILPRSSQEVDKITDTIGGNISNEEQIALAFLGGRESCLRSVLEPCGKDVFRMTKHGDLDERDQEDLARYLKKYIELWREGVYDIVTQYTTIFLEKTSPASQALLASEKIANNESQLSPSPQRHEVWSHLHALVTNYASRALTAHLLPVLSPSLPFLSLSLLPSLLTQLTYCSTAFARIGLEFRGILSSLISNAVEDVVGRSMRSAKTKFVAQFRASSWESTATTRLNNLASSKPSKWLHSVTAPPVPVTLPSTVTTGPPHIPPQILASYIPVAEYTNALLSILNGLRLLAPINIISGLTRFLDDDILSPSGEAVLTYVKTYCVEILDAPNDVASVETTDRFSESEVKYQRRVIVAFGEVFFKVFVPFVRRALIEGVYGIKLDSKFQKGVRLSALVMDWEGFCTGQMDNSDESESEEDSAEDD